MWTLFLKCVFLSLPSADPRSAVEAGQPAVGQLPRLADGQFPHPQQEPAHQPDDGRADPYLPRGRAHRQDGREGATQEDGQRTHTRIGNS